jgi:uncharacterized protein YacL (UPF0231 family)
MFYNNTMLPMPMLPPMHSQYQQLLFQQQQNQLAMSQRLASMTESVSAEEVGMSTVVTPHGGATSTHNNTVDYGGGQKRVRSPSKHAHHVVLSSASNDGSSRKGFDPVVRAASLSALEAGKIARAKLKASMEGTSSLSNSTVAADDVGRAVVQRAEGGQPLLSPPPSPPDSPSRSGSFSSTSGDSSEWLDFVTSVETADKVKNAIKEYLSRLKKAVEKWKQSGNGKGNRRGEGGEIKICFKDTEYIIPQDEDDTEKTDDNVEIRFEYMDDDRIDFCNQDNSVLYVWGLADKYGFVDFCVQNIGVIATKDGMAVSAREGGGRGANNNRKNHLTEAISKLPAAVAQVFEDVRVHDEIFTLQSLLVQHKNLLRQAKTKKEEW